MPLGIFLYEIDESLGNPRVLGDFYLGNEKISPLVLNALADKHTKKDFLDATYREDKFRFYSSIIKAKNLKKKLYLGFILRQDEDLISLKGMFEKIEQHLTENYTTDRRKLKALLKDILSSIMGLLEKLKEPKIIQEKINEKTKRLLDEGKLQEARELIKLGEEIPQQLSELVKRAESYLKERSFKKARKYYEKAAEKAEEIKESDMRDVLLKKAEQCEVIPEYLDDRDSLNKDIYKELRDVAKRDLNLYDEVIPMIEKSIALSNKLEDNEMIQTLSTLKTFCLKAMEKATELTKIDNEIYKIIDKF